MAAPIITADRTQVTSVGLPNYGMAAEVRFQEDRVKHETFLPADLLAYYKQIAKRENIALDTLIASAMGAVTVAQFAEIGKIARLEVSAK